MIRRRQSVRARAMTLFEVVIAVALIALLLSTLMIYLWQSGKVRDQVGRRAGRTQLARQMLDRLAAELRGCIGSDQIGFPVEQRLNGTRRGVTFLTTALPAENQYKFYRESEELPPAQHDLRLLSYELWVDEDNKDEKGNPLIGGIKRTEKKTLNQRVVDEQDPLDLRIDLWSHELGYLEFRYFDGVEWDTKWEVNEGNSLPQLVQITVGFDNATEDELKDEDLQQYPLADYPLGNPGEHPDRYSTIVKIPAADRFFSSRVQRLGTQMTDQLGVSGVSK